MRIEVVNADVVHYDADVLALKYAQQLYGVDLRVIGLLTQRGIDAAANLPAIGESLLVAAEGIVAARDVLFIGVEPLGRFDYETIRQFAGSVLKTLAGVPSKIRHIAMTLHGRGFGLDESEAFRAEIAGILDAVHSGD